MASVMLRSRTPTRTAGARRGRNAALARQRPTTVVFFVIHLRRNFEGLQALLAETINGIVCSDRWSAYSKLPLELRQICWAHLKRDFQKLIDRGGPAEAIGRVGSGGRGLPLRRLVGVPPRRTRPTWPAIPVGPDRARTPRRFGAGLLAARIPGGDLLRQPLGCVPGVVVVRGDRGSRAHEQSCGTHPAFGRAVAEERLRLPQRSGVLRFVERMLTVVQTLRLLKRPVLDFLHRTIVAHRAGLPARRLLGQFFYFCAATE